MQLGKQLAETTFAHLTGLFLALLSIILLTQTSTKECLFPNPMDLFLAKGWQAQPSRAQTGRSRAEFSTAALEQPFCVLLLSPRLLTHGGAARRDPRCRNGSCSEQRVSVPGRFGWHLCSQRGGGTPQLGARGKKKKLKKKVQAHNCAKAILGTGSQN